MVSLLTSSTPRRGASRELEGEQRVQLEDKWGSCSKAHAGSLTVASGPKALGMTFKASAPLQKKSVHVLLKPSAWESEFPSLPGAQVPSLRSTSGKSPFPVNHALAPL